MNDYEMISTAEAAKMAGYTAESFRHLVKRDKPFPCYKMAGNRLLFNRADVLAYIESKRVG